MAREGFRQPRQLSRSSSTDFGVSPFNRPGVELKGHTTGVVVVVFTGAYTGRIEPEVVVVVVFGDIVLVAEIEEIDTVMLVALAVLEVWMDEVVVGWCRFVWLSGSDKIFCCLQANIFDRVGAYKIYYQ